MTTQAKKKPVHKVRFGNMDVSIWENTTEQGEVFNTFNLRRSYKDDEGKWHEQNISLGRNDLMKAAGVLSKAQTDFYTLPQFANGDEREMTANDKAA